MRMNGRSALAQNCMLESALHVTELTGREQAERRL